MLHSVKVVLIVAALTASALTACDAKHACPLGCPAPGLGLGVAVVTTPKMVVNGVEAALTGPVNGTMVCQPNPFGFSVVCAWPQGMSVVTGTYSVQVSAPGYATTTIQVVVATPSPDQCGCASDSITPSSVSISRTDGAVD
jgi:hypothetical protein